MSKFSIYDSVKSSGGTALRKTCKHDGTKARYYAQVEVLGRTYYRRIRKDTYNGLNSTATAKCAFTTHILKDRVQYQHSIQWK